MEKNNKMKRVVASLLMLSFCSLSGTAFAEHYDVSSGGSQTINGFRGNQGTGEGGLVTNNGGTVTLSGTFQSNTTVGNWYGGGVVYSNGGSTIVSESANFINNTSTGANDHGGVMTVINGNINIGNDVTFSGNQVTNNPYGYGGAIYVEDRDPNTDYTVTIGNGVIFSGNSAASGGAVYIGGANTTLGTGVEFSNNESTKDGGAVMIGSGYADTTVTFGDGAKFSGNKSTGGSGGAIQTGAGGYDLTVNLGRAEFTDNEAAVNGGAIFNSDMGNTSTVSTGASTFTGNSAGTYGGAIYNTGGTVNVGEGSSFGAADISYDTEGNITGYTLVEGSGNTAAQGGAIANYESTGEVNIGDNVTFAGNSATVGGAISTVNNDGSTATTEIGNNVTFIGNTAENQAGAIHNQRSKTTIGDEAKFYGNTAKTHGGGAIYNDSSTGNATVTVGAGAQFVNNTAGKSGGAIYNYNATASDNTTVTVGADALFEGNEAVNGGVVANFAGAASVGSGAEFTNNKAQYGGAIYNSAYGKTDKNSLTISGDTTFSGNTATAENGGGAIYTEGNTTLDTTAGDIEFTGNTANGAANDIYLNSTTNGTGSLILQDTTAGGSTNKVSIGSGIAGVKGTSITNNGTTLALESGSKNSGYEGTYTQTSGTTDVNTEFFGGESNINGGNLNLNNGAEIVADSTVTTGKGATTTIADNANVTINGTFTDNGTSSIASTANVVVNGSYTSDSLTNDGSLSAVGTETAKATIGLGNNYSQSATGSLTIGDNATLDLADGSKLEIDAGKVSFTGTGGLAQDDTLTVTNNVLLEFVHSDTVTMDSNGVGVGAGHVAVSSNSSFDMDHTDVSVAGDTLTQNVTVTDADISAETEGADLTIGNGTGNTTLTLSNNATTDKGLIVSDNSTLKLAPTAGGTLTIKDTNPISGTGSVLVDEIVQTVIDEEGNPSTNNLGVGTVIIQSDNSNFTGTYTQEMGTVIAESDSKFFGGANKVSGGALTIQDGATLGGTSNTVDGGVLNLEDGAILDTAVSAVTNTGEGTYGTVNIYNAVEGDAGTGEFEGKTVLDSTAITNGALTYLNEDGSTQSITVTGGGLGLFNNTIITGEVADNSISLVQGTGVSHLTVGDGSGVDADTINLGDETSLTYKDNAYIKQDSTVNLDGSAELNFANETTNISYNPTIVSDSIESSINKSGAGSTSIESSLENYHGSVNVAGGALDLAGDDQSAVLDLSGISVDGGSLTTDAHILVTSTDEHDEYGKVVVTNGGTLNVNNSLEADKLVEVTDSTLNVLGSLASGNNPDSQTAMNFNNAVVNVGEDIATDNIGIHKGSVVNVSGVLESKDFTADGAGTTVNVGEYLYATEDGIGVADGAIVTAGGDVAAATDISVTGGSSLTSGGNLTSLAGSVGVDGSNLNVAGDLVANSSTNGTSLGVTDGSNVTVSGNVSTNQNVAVDNSTLNVLGGLTTEGMVGVANGSDLAVQGDVNFNNYFVVNGDSTAVVNGDVTGQTISIAGENSELTINGDTTTLNGNLTLRDGVLNNFTNMSVAGDMTIGNSTGVTSTPTINMQDGSIGSIVVNGAVNHSSDVNMVFDYDPRGDVMDQIIASNYNGSSQIIVTGINFVNSPDNYTFTIDGSQLIADAATGSGIANLGDSQFIANTALGQYLVTTTSGGGGAIMGSLQNINPQMYRGQVATVAQYANQLAFNNLMFDHAAIVSGQFGPNSDDEIANRYAAANPLFGPYQYSKKDGGLWFKAYGNIENISMTKGLHVDNTAYGAIVGADLPVVELKQGWKLIPTAYVAYNGGHQNYDFVSMYQNGGQIGAMATAYKGNFFTSLLAYGGGYANEMNVRNMGYGATGLADNTGNWFAGVASKSAYNFHLPKNFIIQPTAMVAYNIFGNQNYGSTFGGNLSMNSGFLNGVNVAPGVNVIWNKKTFSIYGTAQMVFNIMGGVDGQAGQVTLDDVRMKHPYFEYGLGVVKSFKERLAGYFQFTIRNGGRTGIGFMGGVQYKLGK